MPKRNTWTEADVRAHNARVAAARRDHRDRAGQGVELERDSRDEPPRQAPAQEPGARYSLLVTHFRHNKLDTGNLHVKATIDGLILRGDTLPDDGPDHIVEETHRQVQIPEGEPERMVFVFTRCE